MTRAMPDSTTDGSAQSSSRLWIFQTALVVITLAGVAAVAVIAAWLGSLTIARNEFYESKLVMWADVVTKRPENSRGRNHLGLCLSERGEKDG